MGPVWRVLMKSVLGHCLTGLAVIAVGVGVTSACVHNDSSLFVQDVIFPTPVSAGQTCTFSANANQTFLPRGVLDVAFRQEYAPWYLVANQMNAVANAQQLQTETSTINVQGAIVRVTDAAGNLLNTYTSLTSGTIYPSTGSVPGYTPLSITAIDQKTVQSIIASKGALLANQGTTTLVSFAKFFGHTLGGTYVESNEFQFPVEVCQGCLVVYSAADVNTTPGILSPNCLGNAAAGGSSASSLPVPCVFGQDTPIDCAQCQEYVSCRGAYPNGAPAGFGQPDGGTAEAGGD